ncbi:MAG: type II secretion system minor pseudopilin GspK [Kiritimatiellia bacterium]
MRTLLIKQTGKRGMVLVLVLVLLGVITMLVVQAQVGAILNLRLRDSEMQQARLREVLTTTVLEALQKLADDDMLSVDHLSEPWAQPLEIEYPSGISVWASITDAQASFDLNNLHCEIPPKTAQTPAEALMNIMTLCGDFSPVERTDALRDWIDPDSDGFYETDFYSRREPPYAAANSWLNGWHEIGFIEGLSHDYFLSPGQPSESSASAGLPDCLSVIPGHRTSPVPVNVNTAPREVLTGIAGLGQEEWARQILVMRKASPVISIEPLLEAAGGDPELLRPMLDVKSSVFCVKASAFYDNHTADLWALVRRDDNGEVSIVRWVM